jgi:hypothetical protein
LKTPESIQVDHLFSETGPPVFGLSVNEIPILLFEYEYRFTEYEYEYEKNLWYESPATMIFSLPTELRICVLDILARYYKQPPVPSTATNPYEFEILASSPLA